MTVNTRTGLILLVVSALALGWSLAGKPNPFAEDDALEVELRDASTLIHFDRDVRLAGAIVGTIGDVRRRGDIAVLELHVSEAARAALRADASAELRPHTLFDGNSFVELRSGSKSEPPLGDRKIPVSRTRNYVSLDRALRVFDSGTRRALQETLRDVRRALGANEVAALRRTFRTVPPLMRDQASWARAAQGPSRRELAGAIAGFSRTTQAISRARRHIGPLLRGTATTAAAFRGRADGLERTLAALPASLRAARSGSTTLQGTLRRARAWATDTTPALRELTPTLVAVRPVLRSSIPVWRETRPLTAEVRGTLAATERAAPSAIALLEALRPVFAEASESLLPYLHSKTETGTSVIKGLLYTTANGASMLSPVKTIAQGVADGYGPGHAQYAHSNIDGTEVSCQQLPPGVAGIVEGLQLCTPR